MMSSSKGDRIYDESDTIRLKVSRNSGLKTVRTGFMMNDFLNYNFIN